MSFSVYHPSPFAAHSPSSSISIIIIIVIITIKMPSNSLCIVFMSLLISVFGEPGSTIPEGAKELVLKPVAVVFGANSAVLGASTAKFGDGIKIMGEDIAATGNQISSFGEGFQGVGSYLFEYGAGFPIPGLNTGDQIETLHAVCKLPFLLRRLMLHQYIVLCPNEMTTTQSSAEEMEDAEATESTVDPSKLDIIDVKTSSPVEHLDMVNGSTR